MGLLITLGMLCTAPVSAQQAAPQSPQVQGTRRGAAGAGGAAQRPALTVAPLFFKVEWQRSASQTAQVPVVQENIADPNVEFKQYGPAARQLLTSGTPGSETTPFSVWSGECSGPFAITFRQKNNYVDLTGLARIRWVTKTSGFHVVRPVVKLANGMLLVGDFTSASVPMLVQREFSLVGVRWLKLDPDRVVTLAGDPGQANETWINNPDLSKVDEVGFADLMPSSGHGPGGYIHLGQIEVYGKPVPREAVTSSR